MAIETTLLQDEINSVLNDATPLAQYYWSAVVHTPTHDIELTSIETLDIWRDYNRDFWDSIQLTGMVGAGTYQNGIVQYAGELELTLTKRHVMQSSDQEIVGKPIEIQRFIVSLLEDPSPNVRGAVSANLSTDAADLSALVPVTFQLLDPMIEQLRMKTIGGIYKRCTPGDVLRVVFGRESKSISVAKEYAVKGVDIVKPNNQSLRDNIIIPHGTKLLSLPLYIQESVGVYTSDIGYYLQNDQWYIYPELDVERFKDTTKTLTVIVIPPNKYPGLKRTYRVTPNQLIVLSTRGVMHLDDSERQQLSVGNGIRYTDASTIMEGFGEAQDNRYTIKRSDNNSEVLLSSRKNGINRAMVSEERITANPFKQLSKLARANCTHLQVTWENSVDSLIYPGMPVRVVYANEEVVREQYGSVLRADHYIAREGENMMTKRHSSTSALTLVLKKEI